MEDHARARAENKEFQNNLLCLKKEKAEQDANRWEQEMALKQNKQEHDKQRWNEEYLLRKEEMQLRREELRLLREQFEHQKARLDSAHPHS
ncbi:unnamed protein product [Phytophthora fragariaefolia]|uniref:Unnamed protein product n=1 Tax=Phytophthora fragariaefolia TaxID=1490495 RepID=A0A9W6X8A5_9STRA|nr:unnamed protein product [Phytophthora fragariaefolia]